MRNFNITLSVGIYNVNASVVITWKRQRQREEREEIEREITRQNKAPEAQRRAGRGWRWC